jgi:hypothetical protein
LIPGGLLVTAPRPVVVMTSTGNKLKVATADVFVATVTVHVLSPLHAPPHPMNIELLLGEAASTTSVPTLKLAPHVGWQLMPEGVLLMVPAPVPVGCTVI